MAETRHFALVLLVAALFGLAAVLSNRLTERLRVPTPLLVLVAAAVAVQAVPALHTPPERVVEEILTVALVCILFDGGAHIGRRRFRAAAVPILVVGVAGTFLTTAGATLVLHFGFGVDWYLAVLVATAIAPTDPAVVFAVLGPRSIRGRSSTILEGESGANDPVGIALMTSLIAAGGLGWSAAGHVAANFLLQMVVGGVVGLGGGLALLCFMRAVRLTSDALHPLRTLASALVLYGAATLLHGSGFLAVFVAGIVVGGESVPYRDRIRHFHAALASLGEIVAFAVLGLTVSLSVLARTDVWLSGLVLAIVVAFLVRPLAVGACLLPARLRRKETAFVLFAGLKGAVPLLLGELILGAGVANAQRWYGIVAIVVIFSVLVQGSLVPVVADRLKLVSAPRASETGY